MLDNVVYMVVIWRQSITKATFDMLKKTHESRVPHKEDIKAAVRKHYGSMDALAILCGVHKSILRAALIRPYPKAEALIAKALSTTAPELWPERYTKAALENHRHWRRLANVPGPQFNTNVTDKTVKKPAGN